MPPASGGKISREATPTAGKISGEAMRLVPLPPPQVRRDTIVGAKMTQFVTRNRQAG